MSKSDTAAKRRKIAGELGPICGLIAIAAIPAAIIPAAAQQESYDWRYLTVAQRPRDQFDAIDIAVQPDAGHDDVRQCSNIQCIACVIEG